MENEANQKIEEWSLDLFHKVYAYWTLVLFDKSREENLKEGLKFIISELEAHILEGREPYLEMELLAKCVVYLEFSLFESGTQINDYKRVLRYISEYLDNQGVKDGQTHKLSFLRIWIRLFESQIHFYEGEFEKALACLGVARSRARIKSAPLIKALNFVFPFSSAK